RKVIIIEDTVRQALRLNDADSIIVYPMRKYSPRRLLHYLRDVVPQQIQGDIDAVAEDEDAAEPTPPSPTPATTPPPPQQELIPLISQVAPTSPPSPHQSPISPPSSPPQQQQLSQPSQTTDISMDLLNTLLETC
nr:hypothetical protein [Tanacetum cinerariifolium]